MVPLFNIFPVFPVFPQPGLGFLQLGRELVSCGSGHQFPRIRGPVPPAQPYSYIIVASYIPWYLDAWTPARSIHEGFHKGGAAEGRPPLCGGGQRPPPFVDGSGRCSSIKHQASVLQSVLSPINTPRKLKHFWQDRSRLFFGARLFQILRFSDFRFRQTHLETNMVLKYRRTNKGVLGRPWTKLMVLRAISSALKFQKSWKC